MDFNDRSFLVLGAGISGISAANVLIKLGADVTLNDAKSFDDIKPALRSQISPQVKLQLGRQEASVLDGKQYLVLSPGISIYHPLVETAAARGITVLSEIELAYHLCKAPIIAVTGTNGKTTTTSLIGEMVKTTGKKTVVGGNIGLALSHEVLGIAADSIVVAEISSFQLEAIHDFRPRIAAVLNMTPDHIDRHRDFATYQLMKERIFHNQQPDDYTVLNYDDPIVQGMADRTPGKVLFFSRKQHLKEGMFVVDGMITLQWQGINAAICPVEQLRLRGAHNLENALAASAVAYLAGVKPADIAAVLRNFAGVEHRIEPVAVIGGVEYYNDSKATNPESTIKALEAFDGHIILIAGGRDKHTDLTEFMALAAQKVDHLILIGEATERFMQAAHNHGLKHVHAVENMTAAVDLAHKLASPPQVVLLSPACASYDMFNNYEERGRIFKALVHGLTAK